MSDDIRRLIEERIPGITMEIRLSEFTSWRIGGPATAVTVSSVGMLSDLFGLLAEEGAGSFVLGRGSNILAPDRGCDRVMVLLRGDLARSSWEMAGKEWRLTSGGGARLPSLAGSACTRGAAGMDFAVGIPGTVGGAIFMNAGAYGGAISDHLTTVRCTDLSGGHHELGRGDCRFRYRASLFQEEPLVVTGADFLLPAGDPVDLRGKARSILALRREKMPLDLPSAGSVFRRPSEDVPPGKLIEDAGLKGRTAGGAMVSRLHANFIVNTGGASSSDVLELIDTVRNEVCSRTGIVLQEEIRYLGREDRTK